MFVARNDSEKVGKWTFYNLTAENRMLMLEKESN